MGKWIERWRERAKALKREVQTLYLALLHPRTPWYAKLAGFCVVAYAISPIDLIPDPIPVIGYLDDLILVPLGILLVKRLIPDDVLAECRAQVAQGGRKATVLPWIGAAVIGLIWLATLAMMIWATWRWWSGHGQTASPRSRIQII